MPAEDQAGPQVRANSRSKEEQLKLRKKMMQYKPLEASGMKKSVQQKANIEGPQDAKAAPGLIQSPQGKQSQPNSELMTRLAKGEKVPVSKHEMHQLTTKNYQNLPEVKKKREEQEKKEELKRRVEKQKNFGKELRSRSKPKKEPGESDMDA